MFNLTLRNMYKIIYRYVGTGLLFTISFAMTVCFITTVGIVVKVNFIYIIISIVSRQLWI
jgi:hypothetical protein